MSLKKSQVEALLATVSERFEKNMGRHNLLVPEDFEGRWA